MTKLSDTQLVILNRAANRDDGFVEPDAISAKAPVVRHNIISSLIKKGLIAEFDATRDTPVWRKDESGQNRGLVITAAGKAALGIEEAAPEAAKPAKGGKKTKAAKKPAPAKKGAKAKAEPKAVPTIREGTKQAQLIAMLKRAKGVTIDEASEAFGWLSHTTRAAISHGIGKRLNMTITSEKDEKRGRVYRITA